jgi:hypothetical protein
VEQVLAGSFLDQLPARPIGDKAYDSHPLDKKTRGSDVELIASESKLRIGESYATTGGAGR